VGIHGTNYHETLLNNLFNFEKNKVNWHRGDKPKKEDFADAGKRKCSPWGESDGYSGGGEEPTW